MNPARDPGLQPERTALAWNRTSLAMAANAVLTLRAGMQSRESAVLAFGVLMLLLSLALAGVGLLRRRQLAAATTTAPAPWLVVATAAAVVVAAIAAVQVVAGPPVPG